MKRERARVLTILRERQLNVIEKVTQLEQTGRALPSPGANLPRNSRVVKPAGMTLSFSRQRHLPIPEMTQGSEEPARMQSKRKSPLQRVERVSSEPLISATVLGSEYPLVVGRPYTMVFKREFRGVAAVQRELLGSGRVQSMQSKSAKRGSVGNFDLDVAFRSLSVHVESDSKSLRMPKLSSLEVRVTPQEPGDHHLEIFVSVPQSGQLLQILQVPLMTIAPGRARQ
jgi:hypothetical protein